MPQNVPQTGFPLQKLKLSVELYYVMIMEAVQNTSQSNFTTQLDSLPHPE
jgi:hypothetical protein